MQKIKQILKKYLTFSLILKLLILIGTTWLLAAAVSRQEKKENANEPVREKLTKLPDFEIDKIRKVRILFGDTDPVELKIADGLWIVSQKGKPEMYANAKMVMDLLTQLSETRLLREYELNFRREADRKEIWRIALGDHVPGRKVTSSDIYTGFQVQLVDDSGKTVLDIMLGQPHFAEAETLSQAQEMRQPDGRYLRLSGKSAEDHRYFLIPHLFVNLQKNNASAPWAERLRMNSVIARDFQNQVRSMEFSKMPEGSVWKFLKWGKGHVLFKGSKRVEKIQPAYIQQKLQLLQSGFSRDIAPDSIDFMPRHFFDIHLNNGFSYKLEMQDSRYDQFRMGRLTIDFRKDRVLRMANESDQAYAERIKHLEQQLAIEKKWFEGKIFVLQPNVITILESVPGI